MHGNIMRLYTYTAFWNGQLVHDRAQGSTVCMVGVGYSVLWLTTSCESLDFFWMDSILACHFFFPVWASTMNKHNEYVQSWWLLNFLALIGWFWEYLVDLCEARLWFSFWNIMINRQMDRDAFFYFGSWHLFMHALNNCFKKALCQKCG